MGFDFKKGTFTTPVVTGTDPVTGVGFTPKAIILWTTEQTAAGLSAGLVFSYGFASGTVAAQQRVIGWSADDAVSTSNLQRHSASGIVETRDGGGALRLHANLNSFDADGFTPDWTAVLGTGQIVHYIALGGSDLLNALVKEEVSGTALGIQAFTGYGFTPDSVMLLCSQQNALGSAANIQVGVGAAGPGAPTGNEWAYCFTGRDGQTMSNMNDRRTALFNSAGARCLVGAAVSSGSAVFEDDFETFDGDGWSIDHIDAHADADLIHVLALEFSASAGVKVETFNKTVNAAPDDQDVTGVGFQPIGLMLFNVDLGKADNAFASVDEEQSVGGGGEATIVQGVTGTWGTNEVIPTEENRSNLSTRIVQQRQAVDQVIQHEGELTLLQMDGFRVRWDPNDSRTDSIFYIAFKEVAVVGIDERQFMAAIRPGITRPAHLSALVGFRDAEVLSQWPGERFVRQHTDFYAVDLSGTLTTAGALTKLTSKVGLAGTLSFVGDLVNVFDPFVGKKMAAIRPGIERVLDTIGIGARLERERRERWPGKRFTKQHTSFYARAFASVLSFAGALQRQTNKFVTGVLSFVGDLVTVFIPGVSAETIMAAIRPGIERSVRIAILADALGVERLRDWPRHIFIRQHTDRHAVALAGTLSFAGALQRQTNKGVAGVLSFAGAVTKRTSKFLTGTLSFVGDLVTLFIPAANIAEFMAAIRPGIERSPRIAAMAARRERLLLERWPGLRSVRQHTDRYAVALAGALTFAGAVTKRTTKSFTGALSFVGALTKRTTRTLAGALSFAGTLARQTNKALAGSISFSGAYGPTTIFKQLAGSLTFAGQVTKRTSKTFSGVLSFVGDLVALIAGVTMTGNVARTLRKGLQALAARKGGQAGTLRKGDEDANLKNR